MQYDAVVTREGDNFNIEFPDCVGCQTFAESIEEVTAVAKEALEGWLEATLAERMVPPRPKRHAAPAGSSVVKVTVGARLSAGIQVRLARHERGLSQGALAELVGVSQQALAKLEDPDANPTLGTLEKVAVALGLELRIDLGRPAPVAGPRHGVLMLADSAKTSDKKSASVAAKATSATSGKRPRKSVSG